MDSGEEDTDEEGKGKAIPSILKSSGKKATIATKQKPDDQKYKWKMVKGAKVCSQDD